MSTILVWLLAISSNVNGGHVVMLQPQWFPSVEACEQVRKNLPSTRGQPADNGRETGMTASRCIQTTVVRP